MTPETELEITQWTVAEDLKGTPAKAFTDGLPKPTKAKKMEKTETTKAA